MMKRVWLFRAVLQVSPTGSQRKAGLSQRCIKSRSQMQCSTVVALARIKIDCSKMPTKKDWQRVEATNHLDAFSQTELVPMNLVGMLMLMVMAIVLMAVMVMAIVVMTVMVMTVVIMVIVVQQLCRNAGTMPLIDH